MTNIYPLHGIRYAGRDGRLEGLLAPPYDVVSATSRREWIDRDSRNILRVDHPAAEAENEAQRTQAYQQAAQILQDWLNEGTLIRDGIPSIYVVRHEFLGPNGGNRNSRQGIIALLPALPWSAGLVRPHEATFSGPKQDRLALLRATGTQTSPVFAVWDKAPGVTEIMTQTMGTDPISASTFEGEMGSEFLAVWAISESDQVAAAVAAFDKTTFYIADGHHRYETALAYTRERASSEPPSVLSFLCDVADPGLFLLPTHRVITVPGSIAEHTLEQFQARLGDSWDWKRVPVGTGLSAQQTSGGDRTGTVFLVACMDGVFLLSGPSSANASLASTLDVSVLHQEIIPALSNGSPSGVEVVFERDEAKAVAAAQAGPRTYAFVMRPASVRDMLAVSDARQTMPQKSTYFYPKVPTGLVLYKSE